MDRMWTLTVAVSEPNSLDSRRVYAPASPSFTAEIMRVQWSAVFSTWYRSSPLGRVRPERTHWTEGTGSPENTPATVRDFPASALTFSGRASIFGGTPVEEENKVRDEVVTSVKWWSWYLITLKSKKWAKVFREMVDDFLPYIKIIIEAGC